MSPSLRSLALGLVALSVATAAASSGHVVAQRDRAFSTERITVQRGESVRFTNQDNVVHHLFSASNVKTFDVAQPPGTADDIVFEQPGTVEVRCAIHPEMRLTVTVE